MAGFGCPPRHHSVVLSDRCCQTARSVLVERFGPNSEFDNLVWVFRRGRFDNVNVWAISLNVPHYVTLVAKGITGTNETPRYA